MLVYVLNKHGKPLMPCKFQKARKLLKTRKAKVVNRCPFTIKLLFGSSGYKQEAVASIAPSSSQIGVAVKSNDKCIYSSIVELRQDIPKRMKRRSNYRKVRRNRKTRYRPVRFSNRKSDRKLIPTMRSKLESHQREVKRVEKILPVSQWMTICNSIKVDYKGFKDLEWLNLQRQTFERDNFRCRYCNGKSKDYELHAHHIIHRENGGENTLENLFTLCKKCHVEYHKGKIVLKIGKHKYRGKLNTELLIIRKHFKIENLTYETYGFLVKAKRKTLKLEPNAINNACAMLDIYPSNSFYIKNTPKGDYQQTKGVRSQQKIPTGKIMGIRKFDKVRYNQITCFIKGRMSNGYVIGMDILNHSLKKLLKLKEVKILQRRTNSLITEMIEGNVCYNII